MKKRVGNYLKLPIILFEIVPLAASQKMWRMARFISHRSGGHKNYVGHPCCSKTINLIVTQNSFTSMNTNPHLPRFRPIECCQVNCDMIEGVFFVNGSQFTSFKPNLANIMETLYGEGTSSLRLWISQPFFSLPLSLSRSHPQVHTRTHSISLSHSHSLSLSLTLILSLSFSFTHTHTHTQT